MKPSRLAVLLASLLAIPATVVAACSFPEIGFGPQDASGASSGAAGGTVTEASASASTSATGTSTSASGGGAPGSSSSSSGLPPCKSAPCDCDGDGENSWECDGGDCADYDPRANTKADFLPDSTPIFGPKRSNTPEFDFNCNTKGESEFGVVGCISVPGCIGKGFAQETKCGQEEALIGCGQVGLNLCTELPNPPKQLQRCR
jgi:hypothetical protein